MRIVERTIRRGRRTIKEMKKREGTKVISYSMKVKDIAIGVLGSTGNFQDACCGICGLNLWQLDSNGKKVHTTILFDETAHAAPLFHPQCIKEQYSALKSENFRNFHLLGTKFQNMLKVQLGEAYCVMMKDIRIGIAGADAVPRPRLFALLPIGGANPAFFERFLFFFFSLACRSYGCLSLQRHSSVLDTSSARRPFAQVCQYVLFHSHALWDPLIFRFVRDFFPLSIRYRIKYIPRSKVRSSILYYI